MRALILKKDSKKPPHVYFKKGRYVYYPYVDGKRGREIPLRKDGRLLREDAPMSQVWACYEELKGTKQHTLKWLIGKYFKSVQYQELAANTKYGYEIFSNTILNAPVGKGRTFGDVDFNLITPSVIRKYIDNRSAKKSANREIQFLSAVFSWAYERDLCKSNPCKGVRKNKAPSRDRYIEDYEYDLVYELAPDYIKAMMELAYLCRARRGEVSCRKQVKTKHEIKVIDTGLTVKDVNEKGVYVHRTKGSLPEVTLWTERLEAAIKLAKSINKDVISKWLLHDANGHPINDRRFSTAWQRLMKKALARGLKEPFTFHDIKAKGISDHKINASGHKSERAKQVYLRKAGETEATR